MRKLLVLTLVPWALAFHVPSGVVVVKRFHRLPLLRSTTVPDQSFEPRRRTPGRSFNEFLPRPEALPEEVSNAANVVTVLYLSLKLGGVDVGDVGNLVGIVGGLGATYGSFNKWRMDPQNIVSAKLRQRFAPPPSYPWTGNQDWPQNVTTFVKDNPFRKTLVLVDPTGNAKPDLLDDLFRGKIHVTDPVMTKLSLEEDLSKFFDLKETKGLNVIAGLIAKAIEPEFPAIPVDPVKLIIKIPDTATDEQAVKMLSDIRSLKETAGSNIVSIVTVANGTFINALPQGLRSVLEILS